METMARVVFLFLGKGEKAMLNQSVPCSAVKLAERTRGTDGMRHTTEQMCSIAQLPVATDVFCLENLALGLCCYKRDVVNKSQFNQR